MTLLRAFIAIEFPAPLQDAIHRQTARLREAAGAEAVRWVPKDNLHLTLKFLGDISPANLQFINQMLAVEAARYPCFTLSVGGLGAFPGLRRPRILWVGVQVPPELQTLQHTIESAAARLGYASEERPFSPHLTIGRVRQSASPVEQQDLRQTLESIHVGAIGQAVIEAVTLMKSDLQPGGAVYTPLFSARLSSPSTTEVKSESA